ncbi:MAG: hypothetical protein RL139_404 [Gemmatimonadota bacterium]|jgi:uncharacterized membrane protein
MDPLAPLHPQVVHFAIALLFLGVPLRLISLTGKLAFTKHAATMLLLLGTVAAVVSVKSGTAAHGPVERIPGARNAVVAHEEAAEQTENRFLIVAALELVALGLAAGASTAKFTKAAYIASAAVGLVGMGSLYETGEHGGELVYAYAGGPGIRSGDTTDVKRLLLAGLYNQAQADRKAGRSADAARLTQEMATRFPEDTTIKFLAVESILKDAKDYPAALAAARSIAIDPENPRWVTRQATLTADIFVAMEQRDSAKAVLAPMVEKYPQNTRLKAKLDSLQ